MKLSVFLSLIFSSILGLSQEKQMDDFIAQHNTFLSHHVTDGYIDYSKAVELTKYDEIIELIKTTPLSGLGKDDIISFYINAYNAIVIHEVLDHYPIPSVKEIGGFFDRKKFMVAGESMTLNEIEKEKLLKEYKDARIHFVLICGAIDCPKISNKAIHASTLDQQLEEATNAAINDASFIRQEGENVNISEIFKWYTNDFGGSKVSVINFINNYRATKIEPKNKVSYYDYDWTLNDSKYQQQTGLGSQGNNSFRYVTSAAISEGGVEVKLFNNLYTQTDGMRSTYFTSSLSFLYGLNNRLNVGFVSRYRRVFNGLQETSPLDVFGSFQEGAGRQRITAFGPQIRWAPFDNIAGLSIQSSFTFPIGGQLSGSSEFPFLDWNGPVFITQLFYDKSIGDEFSLFTEVDILLEEIGGGKSNQLTTPMTSILSWYPKKNVTLYGLAGFSPYISSPFNYFTQLGLGFKYQVTPNFELELLATSFSNRYLNQVDGNAATYNIGFRYSR